jgi:hypothetical protein
LPSQTSHLTLAKRNQEIYVCARVRVCVLVLV